MQKKEISLRSLNKISVTKKGNAIERAFKFEMKMNKKDKALLELADLIIVELYDFLSNVVYDPDSEKPDERDVERMNSCAKYLEERGYNVEPYKQP